MEHHDMDIHDDDKPVGRILSRREILRMIGGGSAAAFIGLSVPNLIKVQAQTPTATAIPDCVVKPGLTEGPYYVAHDLDRMDIRIEPSDGTIVEGMPFHLIWQISDVTGGQCAPLADAQVDVWHCDSDGAYSGVNDPGFDNEGEMWLRGYQITDEMGRAEFLTIVPGWYSSRAVHIHFKVHTTGLDGADYEFTSQLFFDPEFIEELYQQEPYADKGLPDTSNEVDNIYQGTNGLLNLSMAAMTEEDIESLKEKLEELDITEGYVAIMDVGLDLSDTAEGASDSAGGGGMGGPGGGNPPEGGMGGPGGRGGTPPNGTPPTNP